MGRDQDRDNRQASSRSLTTDLRVRVPRILFALLGLLGLSVTSGSDAATEQLKTARLQIEQRVIAARAVLQSSKELESTTSPPGKLAQWSNWPNWGNWGNWFNR
jgi:hypothetical protein